MRTIHNQAGLATVAIVAIIVGVLVAGGAAAYFATDGFGGNEEPTKQATESTSQPDSTKTNQTSSEQLISQALAGGDSIRCDYTSEDGSGVAYITKKETFRVDFNSTKDSESGSFIRKADTIYMWTNNETTGAKFNTKAFDEQNKDKEGLFNPEEFEEDSEDVQKIDCKRDNFDKDLLTPPSNITFQDFASQYTKPQ